MPSAFPPKGGGLLDFGCRHTLFLSYHRVSGHFFAFFPKRLYDFIGSCCAAIFVKLSLSGDKRTLDITGKILFVPQSVGM